LLPIIFGLIGVLLVWGMLHGWTGRSQVVAHRDGLLVNRSWLLGRSARSLAAADVQRIEPKFGMSYGRRMYYDLIAIPAAGKRVKLATMLKAMGRA
jgi:hypothetical protein